MTALVTIGHFVVEAAYVLATVVYLRYFLTRASALRWLCRPVLLGVAALHSAQLALIGVQQGGLPLVGPGQAMSVMVLATVAIYLAIEWRLGRRVMGVFVMALAAVFQLLAAVIAPEVVQLPDDLRTGRLPLHALPAVIGYAGLSLGAVFALLLLALRERIKRRKLGLLYRRLPSLRTLDKMSYHASAMGFGLLTLGAITGSLWAAYEWGSLFPTDPKLHGIALVWLVYALYVASPLVPRWTRSLRAWWSLIGFAALTFTFTVLGLLVESRHSW